MSYSLISRPLLSPTLHDRPATRKHHIFQLKQPAPHMSTPTLVQNCMLQDAHRFHADRDNRRGFLWEEKQPFLPKQGSVIPSTSGTQKHSSPKASKSPQIQLRKQFCAACIYLFSVLETYRSLPTVQLSQESSESWHIESAVSLDSRARQNKDL